MTALGALLRRHPDRAAVVVLVVLPLVLWAPALRPGHTLSPLDNLFTSAPWRAIAPGPVRPNQALGDVTQVFHPWTLWAAHEVRAVRLPARGDRRLVALLALAVALDLVAGYPQAALQALAAVAAWALARAPWRAGAGPFLARVAAGVTLGGALTAVQALPALDYARESAVYAFRSTGTPPPSVPPRPPLTPPLPYFFRTARGTWATWQFNITSTYVGLVPLAALPLAALAWRRPPTRFFAGLAAIASLVHYGGLAPGAPAPGIPLRRKPRPLPIPAL